MVAAKRAFPILSHFIYMFHSLKGRTNNNKSPINIFS